MEAARLFAEGNSRAQVARLLGVSCRAACNWYQVWRERREVGLKAAGRAGRKPRLTLAQLAQVEQALLRGPLAQGYATELWTLPRIVRLIARLTGVKYHSGHVWRLLRGLGWSLQRPAPQAKERDDEAITRWQKRRWPARKTGR